MPGPPTVVFNDDGAMAMRQTAISLSFFLGLLCTGCVTAPPTLGPQPLSEHYRQQMGTVLVIANYESAEAASGITQSKGSGVAKGAGGAAAGWIGGSLQTGDPLSASLLLLFTPVAVVAGGIYGGVVADSADEVAEHVVTLEKIFADTATLYEAQLRQSLLPLSYVPVVLGDDPSVPPLRYGARLEVNFRELSGHGGGPKSMLAFSLHADTRLYLGADSAPVFERSYSRQSNQRPLADWVRDGGSPLQSVISELAASAVQQLVNDYFLSTPYVIEPLQPTKQHRLFTRRLKTDHPEFIWQMNEGQHAVDPATQSGLTFELRVRNKTSTVARVDGLNVARHQFAKALPQCDQYTWQVRGVYEMFGQPRKTNWATGRHFRTSCEK